MVDADGNILKIIDKNSKMVYMEQWFYQKIFEQEENNEWNELKNFIPSFYGIERFVRDERKCILLFTLSSLKAFVD